LLTGGLTSLLQGSLAAAAKPGGEELWLEKSILELQSLMASGELTSRALTQGYLKRIRALNPLVAAVIETNPQAVADAARLDNERRRGRVRGPLHGVPILLKDNIATADNTQTAAGSLALVRSRVRADATVAARLRSAGAVLLGKANLSEWANFRGFAPFNGWSARGGFTRDPYLLDFDPCGSSSGSAVAPALNLCAGAVGTETDGSIVCPAGNNLVVGLKPTRGLLAGDGVIPIAHSQDTAGPICRTVTDAAILLKPAVPSGRSLASLPRLHQLPAARPGRRASGSTGACSRTTSRCRVDAVVQVAIDVASLRGDHRRRHRGPVRLQRGRVQRLSGSGRRRGLSVGIAATQMRTLADLIAFSGALQRR
jgi:Asp-tRNA(Asn)/Glu-tRNA(Gln) amidotransferase A subunit family amidase